MTDVGMFDHLEFDKEKRVDDLHEIHCPGPMFDDGTRDDAYAPGCPNVTDPCTACEGAGHIRIIWGGPGQRGQYHVCPSCGGSGSGKDQRERAALMQHDIEVTTKILKEERVGNVLEDAVNTTERVTISVRPVVARIALLMESLFAEHDGDKTMEKESLRDSMIQLRRHWDVAHSGVAGYVEMEDSKVRRLLGKIANRAALSLLLLDEVGR